MIYNVAHMEGPSPVQLGCIDASSMRRAVTLANLFPDWARHSLIVLQDVRHRDLGKQPIRPVLPSKVRRPGARIDHMKKCPEKQRKTDAGSNGAYGNAKPKRERAVPSTRGISFVQRAIEVAEREKAQRLKAFKAEESDRLKDYIAADSDQMPLWE